MGRGVRQRATIFAIAAATLGGCQLVVPTNATQCKTDADCDGRGGAFAKSVCVDELCLHEADKCLGHVAPSVEDRSSPIHFRSRFVNVADVPVAGVEVFVCAARDEPCDSPVGPPGITDADGYVLFTVWKNFRGTLQVKNPPAGSDLMKTKVHLFPAILVDEKADLFIPVEAAVHLVTRSLLASQVSVRTPLDLKAGHIIAAAVDCSQRPRAGVSVSLMTEGTGGPALQFYFTENRSVSITATETLGEGAFGFANVPEGPAVITATIPSLGRKTARIEFWINKDTISTFQLGPSFIPP